MHAFHFHEQSNNATFLFVNLHVKYPDKTGTHLENLHQPAQRKSSVRACLGTRNETCISIRRRRNMKDTRFCWSVGQPLWSGFSNCNCSSRNRKHHSIWPNTSHRFGTSVSDCLFYVVLSDRSGLMYAIVADIFHLCRRSELVLFVAGRLQNNLSFS